MATTAWPANKEAWRTKNTRKSMANIHTDYMKWPLLHGHLASKEGGMEKNKEENTCLVPPGATPKTKTCRIAGKGLQRFTKNVPDPKHGTDPLQ